MSAEPYKTRYQEPAKVQALSQIFSQAIRPKPRQHAGIWAEENRILPPGTPFPGKWRNSRSPYIVEPFKAVLDPRYTIVVVSCAAQMMKTEFLFNEMGRNFHWGPAYPFIYVAPTQKLATSVARGRIDPMIDRVQALKEIMDNRRGYQSTLERFMAGVRLGFAWAGSSTETKSHNAGRVAIDEVDEMDDDSVIRALSRGKQYGPSFKALMTSTPTEQGASLIWEYFELGTMHMWAWQCPHSDCAEWFVPKLKHMIWPEKATPDIARAEARVYCPECGAEVPEESKNDLNARYIPHVKVDTEQNDLEYEMVEVPRETHVASFWASGLASTTTSFGEIAWQVVRAYRKGAPVGIRESINQYAGELFVTAGAKMAWETVDRCRLQYSPGTLPDGVQIITAGVDPGKRENHYVVRGWGYKMESWLLLNGVIEGSLTQPEVRVALGNVVERNFGPEASRKFIVLILIDSGYNPEEEAEKEGHAIYSFCRQHTRCSPSKGHDVLDKAHYSAPVDVRPTGAIIKIGLKLWHFNTDYYKGWLRSQIEPAEESDPIMWHCHKDIDEEYCRQVSNEQRITKPSGKPYWKKTGNRRNHYWDCEVLATVAAFISGVENLPPTEKAGARPKARKMQRPRSFERRGI